MTEIPIACSLGPNGQRSRGDEWRDLLVPNLLDSQSIPGGIRLVLRATPGVRSELDRLIDLENSCCTWINWGVEQTDVIHVDVTAEQEAGSQKPREWFDTRSPRSSGDLVAAPGNRTTEPGLAYRWLPEPRAPQRS